MCLPSKMSGTAIQRLTTLVGLLTYLSFGLMFGITPPHVRLYQSDETPLNRPIDEQAATLVSSHYCWSAAVGALYSGFVSQKMGPKSVLLLNGLLQITSWFCIHFAYDIVHIYASRIFSGFAAGAILTVLPIFIAEISEDANVASLIFHIEQARALGIFIGFVLGWYLPYLHVATVGICVSFLFSMAFPFVQESPYYHLRKRDLPNLEKSLRWYRGIRCLEDRTKTEFVRELIHFEQLAQHESIMKRQRPPVYLLKVCLYSVTLAMAAQLSGVLVLLNYAELIFAQTAVVYPLPVSVIILAAIQLVGAHLAVWLGEHINRRLLLSITSLICGISLISLAIFSAFGHHWRINPMYTPWLPLILLSIHLLSANLGPCPLATIIMRELLPANLYPKISSVAVASSWLLLFLCIQYFHAIIALFSLAAWCWFFAGACIVLTLLALLALPETRGRSPEEIQQKLGFVPNDSVAKIAIISGGHLTNSFESIY